MADMAEKAEAAPVIPAGIPAQKQHFLWVELLRLIGIWLVILGHIGTTDFLQELLNLMILQVMVFVSGYLESNKRPFKEVFIKNAKGLLVPYILLSALLYAYWFIVDIVFHRDIYSFQITQHDSLASALLKPLIGILLCNGQYETSYSMMIGLAMWFLPVLFILKIAHKAVIIFSRGSRTRYGLCLCASLLAIMAFRRYAQPLGLIYPFCLDRALLMFPFFEFGNIIRESKALRTPEKHTPASAAVYIFTAALGLVTLGLTMPLWDGSSTFLYLLLGITSIVSLVSLCMLYTRPNMIVSLLSNGTLLILAFHSLLIPFARLVFSIVNFNEYLYQVILQSLLIICIFIVPVNITQKYFPVLLGGRTVAR